MCRFLPALIVILAGLLFLPAPVQAQGGRSYENNRPLSKEERKREWGELLLLGLVAGGIGFVVVMQGAREFFACLPRTRGPVNLDDYDD